MAHNNDTDGDLMSQINVTPLVDVMLVVFIVTALLLSPQPLKITLPKTDAVQQNDRPQQISLKVDARGNIELNDLHVSDQRLAEMLRKRAGELQIEADKAVPYGRIAELMALAQQAGIAKLSFVTLAK